MRAAAERVIVTLEDAEVAIAVVCESITRRWIDNPDNHIVVAGLDSAVDGVACLHRSGEVRLCYVAPDRQRVGIEVALPKPR